MTDSRPAGAGALIRRCAAVVIAVGLIGSACGDGDGDGDEESAVALAEQVVEACERTVTLHDEIATIFNDLSAVEVNATAGERAVLLADGLDAMIDAAEQGGAGGEADVGDRAPAVGPGLDRADRHGAGDGALPSCHPGPLSRPAAGGRELDGRELHHRVQLRSIG